MNVNPSALIGMLNVIHSSDVLPQQPKQVSKQLELAEVSQEIRAAYTVLPPDVSREMFSDYGAEKNEAIQHLMNNLLTKEFVLNEVAQGNNLDQDWMLGQKAIDTNVSVDDDWNKGYDNSNSGNEPNDQYDSDYDSSDFTM
ncbi:hypothetical protein [Citrobacter freundii]|uniref:hypothetical protein n=1 Tax=Citrobacter freundii TaxID=546 RepID=UPI00190429F7|nr:hypothetical protein [Citrobacter freundii]MBJ8931582.1 hypothetical protein [Citrobacter freundii]